jgi:monoamine oxidase
MGEALLAMNSAINGKYGQRESALKILIVGAGIGGLSSAIGLRMQGHNVQVRV